MKTVLVYDLAQDGLRKVHLHDDSRSAWLDEFYSRGLLLMAGPFANPAEGYMGVFTTREAAEEFIRGDPFVTGGVVSSWTLRDWDEVLS
jgi:uncharacterized protein YciI